jgi:acyl-coenzyme A synthetase/AMP-(fatty) acid ligase
LEAAVIGISHPKWMEVPKAYVVLKEGKTLSGEQIMSHCTAKMAKFKVPKEIEFIDELPRNPSGKVLKRELRAMHTEDTEKGG